jgi:hypothetical protein
MFRVKNIENIRPGDLIKNPHWCYHKTACIVINNKHAIVTHYSGPDFCRIEKYYELIYLYKDNICLYQTGSKFKIRVWCDK